MASKIKAIFSSVLLHSSRAIVGDYTVIFAEAPNYGVKRLSLLAFTGCRDLAAVEKF